MLSFPYSPKFLNVTPLPTLLSVLVSNRNLSPKLAETILSTPALVLTCLVPFVSNEPDLLPPTVPISSDKPPNELLKKFSPKNIAPVGIELTFLLGRLIFATTLDITRPLSPAVFLYPTPAVSRYWFAPSSSRTLSFLLTSNVKKEFSLPQCGVPVSSSSLSPVL